MEEKEKRMIDDDPNVYKVLAMLLEPIVVREYEKMEAHGATVVDCPALADDKREEA